MDNALYRLQLGTMELKRATVLAKMVADSVDGLKMLLEYRQQYAQKHNRLRVLWWRVIRRVLTQNYVERVKERLLNSSMRDWYVQTLQNTQQQRELAAQLDFAEAEVDTVSIIEHTIPCRRSSLEPIEVTSMNEEQLNRRLDQLAARGAEKRAEKQSLTPRERLAERRRNRYTYDGTPSRPQESHSVNCLLGGNRGQAPHLSPIQGKRHKLNTDPRGASATLSTVRPSTQEGGRREALDSDEDNDMMSSKLTTDARRPQTSCSTSRLAPEDLLNEERERKLRQLAKLCLTPVSQTPNKGKGISPRPS